MSLRGELLTLSWISVNLLPRRMMKAEDLAAVFNFGGVTNLAKTRA
jgi:hypothetical protein